MASAAERAYLHLREAILGGSLERGSHLPEEPIASRLGISRTPVREALRRLAAEGLVTLDLNRGAQVIAWTTRDIDEIYGIRALLESHGTRLTAQHISAEQLEELSGVADDMERAAEERGTAFRQRDIEYVTDLNLSFHRLVLEAAQNNRLLQLFTSVTAFPVLYRAYREFSLERFKASNAEHRILIRALSVGDEDFAGVTMQGHILAARAEQRRLEEQHPTKSPPES